MEEKDSGLSNKALSWPWLLTLYDKKEVGEANFLRHPCRRQFCKVPKAPKQKLLSDSSGLSGTLTRRVAERAPSYSVEDPYSYDASTYEASMLTRSAYLHAKSS